MSLFVRNLKIVAVAHVSVVLALVVFSGWQGCPRRKPEIKLPVEFLVEAREPSPPQPVPHKPVPPRPEVKPEPPAPAPKPIAKPTVKPVPKPVTKPVQPRPQPPPVKPLTAEEIAARLAKGARLADRTTTPDDDSIMLENIRRALYDAWVQPSAEEVGDAAVVVEIRIAADGRILSKQVIRSSKIPSMDASVERALSLVTRVPGVSVEFLRKYDKITIAFRVE